MNQQSLEREHKRKMKIYETQYIRQAPATESQSTISFEETPHISNATTNPTNTSKVDPMRDDPRFEQAPSVVQDFFNPKTKQQIKHLEILLYKPNSNAREYILSSKYFGAIALLIMITFPWGLLVPLGLFLLGYRIKGKPRKQ